MEEWKRFANAASADITSAVTNLDREGALERLQSALGNLEEAVASLQELVDDSE